MNIEFASKMAVFAVENNDLDEWIESLKECEIPDINTPLGKDLADLRSAYWHDGTYEDRLKVVLAAAKLNFRLNWKEPTSTK